MIGRKAEMSALTAALGFTEGIVVEGGAGIGKTTLVAAVADAAQARGLRVLRCTGFESFAVFGYSGLQELLPPLMPLADALPGRQREALLVALGLADGSAPDPLLVNLALLGLLEEAAAETPVVVVADDAQWLDPSSLAALEFIATRLRDAPVTLLAAVRTGNPVLAGAGVRRLRLGALSAGESAELLSAAAPGLPGDLRERILAEAAGNPLALRELGGEARHLDAGGSLPITRRIERAFLGDLSSLPEPSRRLLLVAAAGGSLAEVLAAGALAGAGPADLEPLEHNRLIVVEPGRLEFTHPLVRSAVYGAASLSQRASAHRWLAEVVTDPVRAAWHRASATPGLDEEVARELTEAAEVARSRGALREAVEALRRAAALSPAVPGRAHRLALAAELARQAGLSVLCQSLLLQAMPLADASADAVNLAATELLLGIEYGTPVRGAEQVIGLAARIPGDNLQRMRALNTAIGRAWGFAHDPETMSRLHQAVLDLVDEGVWQRDIGLAITDPAGQAPRVRPRLPELLAEALAYAFVNGRESVMGSSRSLSIFVCAAEAQQDLDTAGECWELFWRFHHCSGTLADESFGLQGRGLNRLLRGDLSGGVADAEQALDLAHGNGLVRIAGQAAAIAALGHALRGETAEAEKRIADSAELNESQPYALTTARAHWAAGLLAAADGRHAQAWRELAEVAAHPATGLWALADLAEAGTRSGHTEEAEEAVAAAEKQAAAFGSAHLWAIVHRARAIVSPDEGSYLRSMASAEEAGNPLELARTRLAYAEWLRRGRHIVRAREPLQAALAEFRRAGAAHLAERAARELLATGTAPAGARDADRLQLTPQELRIAELAAGGLTNKEIADQLHLSPRTVATHLYKAFPKLGVTTRAQLARSFR
ncbi:LuxR family transcriptional regulator [Paractinoplanes deccanensis]|uniref:LuxR family transcriptional regulator n=1 Tax=Paractinoplanes deccanensis TaxID=113561 RepID=A0ABQ3Y2N5_9ACTN|nr:helix-turn-helix transcriptional regulator [Actinoplanes deccanensis]GID74254.1 LuxR family transcriptional regulator [Actinoplanes deccanensis]